MYPLEYVMGWHIACSCHCSWMAGNSQIALFSYLYIVSGE